MRISIKFTAISLLVLLILAVLYEVASQFQMPEWMLQFTFYAFMTAIFGFVFGVLLLLVRDHLSKRKMKKARNVKELEALKAEYSRCKWSIENSLEKYIQTNEMTDFVARLNNTIEMGEMRVSDKLQKEIQDYDEKLKDYNFLRRASETYIRDTIDSKVRRMFPKTEKKGSELHQMLGSDFLMARYFEGERITENWFKETQPTMLKNITKEIDETERYELDVLFNEINGNFKNEDTLLRFRKQKEAVIEQGKKIIKNLEEEIVSLDRKLKKYDYLEGREDSSSTP